VLTLDRLNASDREAFVSALGGVFDGSPWIAERAWLRRPFEKVDGLFRAMIAEIDGARREEQLALLRAHPDLGSRMRMSAASALEQSGAGLTELSAVDGARLEQLNSAYREKFGFPFLLAVKDSSPADILAALERRLERTVDSELDEALHQVHRIGWFRLQELVGE
jgi:2-oxo-4-hydroxy-4-carboxy-5-ureidoimidazoline decarboxylase